MFFITVIFGGKTCFTAVSEADNCNQSINLLIITNKIPPRMCRFVNEVALKYIKCVTKT